ncbi:MAG: hypothetical protein RSB41_00730 [Bacilli bacterium]
MKKICLVVLFNVLLVLSTGCTKKNEFEKEYKLMNDTLKAYSEKVFFNDNWLKGGIKEGEYTVSLKDMKEKLMYDTKMFVNPKTNKSCDEELTKVVFTVKTQTAPNLTNYEIKNTLVCGN